MTATTHDVIKLINKMASFNLAEDWDNSGLQAGNLSWVVKKILIALDITVEVMLEAVRLNADLVLTHHPLFIKLPQCIDFSSMPGSAISMAAIEKISIVSAHTNLDKAENGLNDYFAEIIGLQDIVPLISNENDVLNIGRKGKLEKADTLNNFALKIKKSLNLNHLRVIGNNDSKIQTVTVVTGSGGSMVDKFIQSETDVFITGDVKYHEARVIEENKLGMIDVGHFGSEHIVIQLLADKLASFSKTHNYDFEIFKYENESDPFNIV